MPSSTYGSCKPISTNTSPFNKNSSASQTAHAWSRTPAEKKVELRRLINKPHTTTAITPEPFTASPVRYAAYGTISDRAISTGPPSTQRSNNVTTDPMNRTTNAPPIV